MGSSGRSFEEVRSLFINTPLEHVPEEFERLAELSEDNSLYLVALPQCRDPLSFGSLKDYRKLLNDFLKSISTHKDDQAVSCHLKLQNRLEAAKLAVESANSILEEQSPELVKLKLANEEIQELGSFYRNQSSFCKWVKGPDFVISTQEMGELKRKLLLKIDEVQMVKTQREEEVKIMSKSFLESKTLPKISARNWHRFLKVWSQEKHNLKTVESKLNAIKGACSNEADRALLEHSKTESDCFSKLYLKYGTPRQVSKKLIADIENSKAPGVNAIEGFLLSIIITAEYIEVEKQTVIITPERITKIVSNTLEGSLALEWVKILYNLKKECEAAFVPTADDGPSFEELWQTSHGATILARFKEWCKQLINLGRDVALPVKSSSSQGGSRGGSAPNASNPVKASVSANNYKCPLCGGSHPDRRGKARRYLAACNAFTEQSIHQRWGTIRKLSHCQVCTSANDHGRYGVNCTLKRLACKLCPDKPHHPLLCSKATSNATTSSSSNPPTGA